MFGIHRYKLLVKISWDIDKGCRGGVVLDVDVGFDVGILKRSSFPRDKRLEGGKVLVGLGSMGEDGLDIGIYRTF